VLSSRPRSESMYGLRSGSPAAMIEHAVGAGQGLDREAFAGTVEALSVDMPPAIAAAIGRVLARIPGLPTMPPSDVGLIPLKPRRGALPDWLMPRRTIGAFYVVSALGSGGVSSVFVAKRIEERRDSTAEVYALKVPEYDPSTARSLSEHEFMDLFRDEAGALLSLPRHTNLARFVNFDAAAKPKPILVMELIRGQSLEKLIKNALLSLPHALEYLDGILGGLIAMHSVGIAHLDLKPSNVILRDEHTAALVDFGLSGRQLRAGCGTLEYCAPEVLGVVPEGITPPAPAADIYSFGCLAYELLCGVLLFDADEETALMSQHVSHDGWPEQLRALATTRELHDLAVLIGSCIRRDPRNRPSAAEVKKALGSISLKLNQAHLNWPLPVQAVDRASRAV
jgi:serine/threonine protein kinase